MLLLHLPAAAYLLPHGFARQDLRFNLLPCPVLPCTAMGCQDGISAMVAGLRNEFMNTMRLMGVTSVDQLRPRMVDTQGLCQHSAPAPSDHYTLKNYVPLETAMGRHEIMRQEQMAAAQAQQVTNLEAALAAEKAKVAALEAQLAAAQGR